MRPAGTQPRGPKTDMRMTLDDVAAVVEPAGLVFARVVELPPYHYGAVFQKLTAYSASSKGDDHGQGPL